MIGPQPKWLELSLQVHREAIEPVTEILSHFGYDHGVALDEPFLQDADGDNLRVDPTRPVTVRTWVLEQEFSSARREAISQALWHLGRLQPVGDLVVGEVAETDWRESWKEHFRPVRAGQRVVVRPPWFAYEPDQSDIVVVIDPGMAFGAGTHPTTRLAIQALEEAVRVGDTVLDVGAGSGILAISACLLGASRVDAVEIDEASARQGRKNVTLNHLENCINFETGSFDFSSQFSSKWYDVTVANIIARVLIELSERLAHSIRPEGVLLLSGIIDSKEIDVTSTFSALGLEQVSRANEEDWVSQVWRRPVSD